MDRKRKQKRPRSRAAGSTGHIRHNRTVWDRVSVGYDRRHARVLGGTSATAWGLFRVPESELGLLGDTRRKAVLELGCGAARWSIALARGGARPTGLDLSLVQLARARELQRESNVRFPLVRASAERLPFRDAAFDLVFCDWGAMTFADPMRSVPECVRVLRHGGRLVFATASPLRYVTLDLAKDRQSRRLIRPYFGSHRIDLGSDAAVEFQLPYGAWIDLFRRNGLTVERLVETRPTPGRRSTYLSRADADWGRSWPLETIWKLRKE
ncbi:MAG TPA: class I SAM-dependent methyltransferase [Thermoplasmata archaeon]